MQPVINYVLHPYVSTWFLSVFVGGYFMVYVAAKVMGGMWIGSSKLPASELVDRGYTSWIVPISLHFAVALCISGFLLWKIWIQKKLTIDWMFLLPMMMLTLSDVVLLASIITKKRRILGRIQ